MAILGSVEYSTGRKSANKYRPRPKHIQIPFQKIFPTLIRLTHFFNQKNQFFGHFTKISIFGQVLFLLFLLLFGVPQCCFFKSMIFQLSFAQKIIIISFLDQKLCQFEIWSIPCYWVIFNVITYVAQKKGHSLRKARGKTMTTSFSPQYCGSKIPKQSPKNRPPPIRGCSRFF